MKIDPKPIIQFINIPLALAEFDGQSFHFLAYNQHFTTMFTALGGNVEQVFNDFSLQFAVSIHNNAKQCIREDREFLQDFVTENGFHKLRVRCIDYREKQHTAVLLLVAEQVLTSANIRREEHKVALLPFLYTLYNRVDLLSYDGYEIDNIWLNSSRYRESFVKGSVKKSIQNFAQRNIYLDDQKNFIDFFDLTTLDHRLWEVGGNHVTDYFRTRDGLGNYSWQMYMLIPIVYQEKRYFLSCASGIDAERMRRLPEIDRMGTKYYDMPGNPVFLLLASHAFTSTLGYGSFEKFLQSTLYIEASLTNNTILYVHFGNQRVVKAQNYDKHNYDETIRAIILSTVVGDKYKDVIHFFDRGRLLADYVAGKVGGEIEFLRKTEDDQEAKPRYLHTCYQIRESSEHSDIHVFFLSFDIDGYRRANESMLELIERDTLTGLYNRGTAVALIRKYLAVAEGRHAILMLLDLDHFKQINDRFGHECGDRILKDISLRMQEVFKPYGLLARIGGDEFLILLKNMGSLQADELLEEFSKTQKRINYHGHPIDYTLSIGYAIYPNHGVEYQDLYQNADMALYDVKMHGHAHFRRFSAEMEELNRVQLGFSLTQIAEGMPGGFLIYRANAPHELLYANPRLLQLYECDTLDELRNFTNNTFRGCVADEDWDRVQTSIQKQINMSHDLDYVQYRIKTARGNIRIIEHYGRIVHSGDNGDVFYVFLLDLKNKDRSEDNIVHAQPRTEEEQKVIANLRKEHRKHILDGLFEGFSIVAEGNYIAVYDAKLNVTRWSAGAVDIFRLPGEYVDNGAHDWGDLLHPNDRERYLQCMAALINGSLPFYDIQYPVLTKDGNYTVCTSKGVVIPDENGNPDFIGGTLKNHDILSHMDSVTGILNQYAFFQEISTVMAREEVRIIILLGINMFTQINDMRGYNHGNHVLQAFSRLLKDIFQEVGIVYRMDGTKFAVIAKNIDEQKMSELYAKVRQQLLHGFYVDTIRHNLTVNAGLVKMDNVQVSEKTIYSCLNYAYRESKNKKHGDLVTFQLNMHEDNRKALERINVIRDCVLEDCKGFYLCYQPIMDAKTEQLVAMEALLRWHSEPYGEVPPFQFIPVLEEDAIFPELGTWILRQTMLEGQNVLKRYPQLLMHVNLSYVQIEKDNFQDTVFQVLKETNFPPQNLCLEITEGCRLLELERLISIVKVLREHKIRIALDDFGTGFASIDILQKLPVDIVKIDREFVKDVESGEQKQKAVLYIAELARVYGSEVCAEGVETTNMRDLLRKCPIDTFQGFLYSKPIPYKDFMAKNF